MKLISFQLQLSAFGFPPSFNLEFADFFTFFVWSFSQSLRLLSAIILERTNLKNNKFHCFFFCSMIPSTDKHGS